jgi:transposase
MYVRLQIVNYFDKTKNKKENKWSKEKHDKTKALLTRSRVKNENSPYKVNSKTCEGQLL